MMTARHNDQARVPTEPKSVHDPRQAKPSKDSWPPHGPAPGEKPRTRAGVPPIQPIPRAVVFRGESMDTKTPGSGFDRSSSRRKPSGAPAPAATAQWWWIQDRRPPRGVRCRGLRPPYWDAALAASAMTASKAGLGRLSPSKSSGLPCARHETESLAPQNVTILTESRCFRKARNRPA